MLMNKYINIFGITLISSSSIFIFKLLYTYLNKSYKSYKRNIEKLETKIKILDDKLILLDEKINKLDTLCNFNNVENLKLFIKNNYHIIDEL
jgi:hypothetical protein